MHLHKTPPLQRASGITKAALVFLATTPLASIFAQTAPATPAKPGDEIISLEAFVSTGTRFNNRTVTESPVPIDVISRNEITSGGYTETAQILQTLIPPFNSPRP